MLSDPHLALKGSLFLSGLLMALFLISTHLVSAASQDAEQQMSRGSIAFQRGNFENAAHFWSAAVDLYEKEGERAKQVDVLIRLSEAYQALGQYGRSQQSLHRVLKLARGQENSLGVALASNGLGNVYFFLGNREKARRYLEMSLVRARELKQSELVAMVTNNLGNLLVQEGKHSAAQAAFDESAESARLNGNHFLVAKAQVNAAKGALRANNEKITEKRLRQAMQSLEQTADSHDKAYQWIAIGRLAHRLAYHEARSRWQVGAYESFKEAAGVAERIGDPRAASYALGYTARLYEDENRFKEAFQLTQQAIEAIQSLRASEILYRWQWQSGRLLKALGDTEGASAAYQRAAFTLRSIRQDLSASYRRRDFDSFREGARALLLELTDLLLQSTEGWQDRDRIQARLMAARRVMEQLKTAELRDYFEDECVAALEAKRTPLEGIASGTAVVYPILLSDRTELLLSLPDGLRRFTVPVDSPTLTQEIRAFRRQLEKRTTRQYLPHAQKLYDWLIRPLERVLRAQKIHTLVFIPDGPLRTVPMAALHDGEQFLIRRYAIATTPGLTLTDPHPLARTQIQLLANGLTEAVQGFPPLPYVKWELESIQSIYGGKILKDQNFLLEKVRQELSAKPFTIVHIASHGQFKSDPRNTFVLTFDDKLTMDRLERFMGLSRFREKPVEILTLSACETAAGDDRAALGLAGIAVKAGARSALASLWLINDRSSAMLVTEFYRQLKNASISKAEALQKAQLKLLDQYRYRHPGYWSAFLLIGNWL
ncbi:MAG: CHAT domain-containing protein [Methylothermaceae bacterium]|nr:CHAT domain-containing protein [Methylothermaceae bacterium]